VLKRVRKCIQEDLADVISRQLEDGTLPKELKETITVALRKPSKKDYTLVNAYRPIALENTIAKVIETIVAKKLAAAAEKHNLLPWTQMGGRQRRSTITAIRLLTESVQTAWQARKGCVVSMLGLDIAGAFDNVSHERLLNVLWKKGIPNWAIRFIQDFLNDRTTRITYAGYMSERMEIRAGIPQGSPLSPILFLFFIAELLEEFERPGTENLFGFGFIDDTTLVAWGDSASDNCKRLTAAHDRCIAWAKRYGAKFAPDKYQLMHFTKRRGRREDLASTVQIGGDRAELCKKSIRILGVWVDPKLQWKEHCNVAAMKGEKLYSALTRIAASTWGPSMKRSRLLYTAVVRPTMAHGFQVWSQKPDANPTAASTTQALEKIQTKCLRKITGAYKGTSTAAVQREAGVPPLKLWVETQTLQYIARSSNGPAEPAIERTMQSIWRSLNKRPGPRPPTRSEIARIRADKRMVEAKEIVREREQLQSTRRNQRTSRNSKKRRKSITLMEEWMNWEWERRWRAAGKDHPEATWNGLWTRHPGRLYNGLTKAQATALFLLRTEVIGLNNWLARRRVPGVDRTCPCGWRDQTVQHVIYHCRRHDRSTLLPLLQTERARVALQCETQAPAIARWLIQQDVLQQFKLANVLEHEETTEYQQVDGLSEW
jgi:hypothetical protein